MFQAALFVASSLVAPSVPAPITAVTLRDGFQTSMRAREAAVRAATVETIEVPTLARSPLTVERAVASFDTTSGERWTRSRLPELPRGSFAFGDELASDLVERLRASEPETVTVYDGRETLEIARRIEVEGWAGALHKGLPIGARRGALHAAGLLYDDRWLSDVLAGLELVRVDADVSTPGQRVWLFARRFAGTRVEAHVLVTSTRRRDLVVFHRAQELDAAHFDAACGAYAPGVVATWTQSGTTFETTIDASSDSDGIELPTRARTSSTCAWIEYGARETGDGAFDPRRAPRETGSTPLWVVDARTLEPLELGAKP